MPYFITISEKIRNSAEFSNFRTDLSSQRLTPEQKEQIRTKFQPANATHAESIDAFVSALPDSYKPNLAVLESQRKIQDKVMDVMTDVEIDIMFSPIRSACIRVGTFKEQRSVEALAGYIDLYGSKETREALYEIINTEPFDADKFKEEFNKFAPGELKKAADHMADLNNRIMTADTPEKKLDLYREVRIASSMGMESEKLLPLYKDGFTQEELADAEVKYGSLYGSSNLFLTEVSSMAHPLASFVDFTALKKLPEPLVYNLIDKNLISKLGTGGSYLPEIVTLTDISTAKVSALADWTTAIRNQVGANDQPIIYRTIMGKTGVLDAEAMDALYEAGDPFYAIPIEEADKKDPILCQPFFGNKLLVGEAVANPPAFPDVPKPKEPSFVEKAVDSLISVIGDLFGKAWGLNSVRRYEAELERFQESEKLRAGVTRSKVYYNNSMKPGNLQAAQKDLTTKANAVAYEQIKAAADIQGLTVEQYQEKQAQLQAAQEARAKAKAEEKLKAEANAKAVNEKKEGLKDLKLGDKDLDFMAQFQVGLDKYKADLQAIENPSADDLARVFVAFSESTKMDFEFKRLKFSEDKSLSSGYDKAKQYGAKPENYFSAAARNLADDPVFQSMTKNMPQDKINAMCKQPIDAKVASELSKFALEYRNLKTKQPVEKDAGKELQQKEMAKESQASGLGKA